MTAALDPRAWSDRRVLIVAPHPDDEVFGAGGTLHLAAHAGAEVVAVIVADGQGGVDGRATAGQREAESRRGCELLGVREPHFLRLSSAELRRDPRSAGHALARALAELGGPRFDVILVPSPLEGHATHRAALLAALWAGLPRSAARWWGWGVWEAVPLGPRTVEVDISLARAAKALAMTAHGSQQAGRSFAAGMSARDMSQAIFSQSTGAETRRAVERLLDLSGLPDEVPAGADAGWAEDRVRGWLNGFFADWGARLWSPAQPAIAGRPGD